MRRGILFTPDQLEEIRNKVSALKTTDELSMLVYLILSTDLKMKDLLGWFNKNPLKRREYLNNANLDLLEDYESVPLLFPKTHHAYLVQWKRACKDWIGVEGATFEMLKRKPKPMKEVAVNIGNC